MRKTPLPEAADAGFDALMRAPQRLGTPGIFLSKRQSEVESRRSLAVIVGEKSFGKCPLTIGRPLKEMRHERSKRPERSG